MQSCVKCDSTTHHEAVVHAPAARAGVLAHRHRRHHRQSLHVAPLERLLQRADDAVVEQTTQQFVDALHAVRVGCWQVDVIDEQLQAFVVLGAVHVALSVEDV